jgi:orotidine-5'-phosphate decarboxylase
MIRLTEKEEQARTHSCLALDLFVRDAPGAISELSDLFAYFKVGKRLFIDAANQGGKIIQGIYRQAGISSVILDLKLQDTPDSVYHDSIAAAAPGVSMFTVHVAGGEAMCKAALEGARQGAERYRLHADQKLIVPKVIGVTALTSMTDDDLLAQGITIPYETLVRRRTELARKWGLDGIMCPAVQAGALEKEFGSDFIYLAPGIEWNGIHGSSQEHYCTPDVAMRESKGAILVAGSAVLQAPDRREAAYGILQAISKAMEERELDERMAEDEHLRREEPDAIGEAGLSWEELHHRELYPDQ